MLETEKKCQEIKYGQKVRKCWINFAVLNEPCFVKRGFNGLMNLQKVSAQVSLRSPRRLTWPKLFTMEQLSAV